MSKKIKYNYPAVNMPISAKLHPDINRIHEELRRWVIEFRIHDIDNENDKYNREELVRFACHTFPNGDYQRTLIIAKFMVHVFALDDAIAARREGPFFRSLMNHDNSYNNLSQLLDKAAEDQQTPIAVSFTDFWCDMKELSNETWQNRFAGNYIWYLKANEWERNNIYCNHIPKLAQYLEYRHHLVCIEPSLNLIEFSRNIFIPDSILANPILQRLSYLAGTTTILNNDIYSFEKERKEGEFHNSVIIMKNEYNVSYQEAINRATSLMNENIEKFFTLQELFPTYEGKRGEIAKIYLEDLRYWMAGDHEWTITTGRYPRGLFSGDDL